MTQTDRIRWGYTPTGYISTQADWRLAAPGVDMQPPALRDWLDVLIVMAPAYRTSDYRPTGQRRQANNEIH